MIRIRDGWIFLNARRGFDTGYMINGYLSLHNTLKTSRSMRSKSENVDEYIKAFPKNVQKILERVRATIKEKAPEAVESISYGMPAYKTQGRPLVYFAGYERHVGFYATPTGHVKFAAELSKYKQGKGSVQFPIHKPIPFDLIARIVEFRVIENSAKYK